MIFILINTLLAWVRNISKFKYTFLFANIVIIFTVCVACYYSIMKLKTDDLRPDVEPINYNGVFQMLGFSVYTYEGIGIIMPCM